MSNVTSERAAFERTLTTEDIALRRAGLVQVWREAKAKLEEAEQRMRRLSLPRAKSRTSRGRNADNYGGSR